MEKIKDFTLEDVQQLLQIIISKEKITILDMCISFLPITYKFQMVKIGDKTDLSKEINYDDIIKFYLDLCNIPIVKALNIPEALNLLMAIFNGMIKDTINYVIKSGVNYEIELTKKTKELDNIFIKLINTDLMYSFYYPDYENIRLENNFTVEERDEAYKLGLDNFKTWKFAFFILAIRNKNNSHFKSIFTNEDGEKIKFDDYNSLDYHYSVFNNAYNVWKNRHK